jgi:hypothetical protein
MTLVQRAARASLWAGIGVLAGRGTAVASDAAVLAFTPDGKAKLPADYRSWPFLTSGLDMSYQQPSGPADMHMLDNVFVSPAALRAFQGSGHWPEGTVLVKEDRPAQNKGSINKAGFFQAEVVEAVELHVKDSARFKGGWGFFSFSDNKPAAVVSYDANCYTCHAAHGATETTFVQFYPTLAPIARAHGTFNLQEDAR